jgi:hypothetical protein
MTRMNIPYMPGDMAQVFLPGDRKSPDYEMKRISGFRAGAAAHSACALAAWTERCGRGMSRRRASGGTARYTTGIKARMVGSLRM